MNRTDTFILELNKNETRLVHNMAREWLDNHSDENEVIIEMAEEIADSLFDELKGVK